MLGIAACLSACGGGGGDSDDEDSFSYSGNTDRAIITPANATRLVVNVLGNATTPAGVIAYRPTEGATFQSIGQAEFIRKLSDLLTKTVKAAVASSRAAPGIAARIEFDQTDPCQGGATHLEGTLNDNGIGTLTVDYDGCRYGSDTIDGRAKLRIHAFDLGLFAYTDATYSFPRLQLSGPGYAISISGSIRVQSEFSADTGRLIANMVTRDDIGGAMTMVENFVIEDVFDDIFSSSAFTETLTGRIFDSVHGFVDIETLDPFVFSPINNFFTDSGQFALTGDNGGTARFTVKSLTLVWLELDLDGDTSSRRRSRWQR